MAIALQDQSTLALANMQRSLREIVKEVIHTDEKDATIRAYLQARSELETSANRAHELLSAKFAESTGIKPQTEYAE